MRVDEVHYIERAGTARPATTTTTAVHLLRTIYTRLEQPCTDNLTSRQFNCVYVWVIVSARQNTFTKVFQIQHTFWIIFQIFNYLLSINSNIQLFQILVFKN